VAQILTNSDLSRRALDSGSMLAAGPINRRYRQVNHY
jgi:hypothetical protein